MLKYILKRVGYTLLALFIITTATFFLVRLIPGNPIEAMTEKLPDSIRQQFFEQYGFDKPLTEQYKLFWENLLTKGDLGESGFRQAGASGDCHWRGLRHYFGDSFRPQPGKAGGLLSYVHCHLRHFHTKLCNCVPFTILPFH